jgi:cellobiose-specific phosphotransferase system component IIC
LPPCTKIKTGFGFLLAAGANTFSACVVADLSAALYAMFLVRVINLNAQADVVNKLTKQMKAMIEYEDSFFIVFFQKLTVFYLLQIQD